MTGTEITLDGACSELKAIGVLFSPICDSYSIKSYIHGIFKSYSLAIFGISTTVAKEMGTQTQRCQHTFCTLKLGGDINNQRPMKG